MAAGPVLLCYDGSHGARRAIAGAGELLGGGSALVLTVWKPFKLSLLSPVSDTVAMASGMAAEFDEVAAKIASEEANEGARLAGQAGFDASPLVEPGQAPEVIIRVAQQRRVRAIVLGSRGLGGAESVLLGSVSTAVLHHCRDVPLLVVPEPEG